MHHNEVKLARRLDSGVVIPTHAFAKYEEEAKTLGPAHVAAFELQKVRQRAELESA